MIGFLTMLLSTLCPDLRATRKCFRPLIQRLCRCSAVSMKWHTIDRVQSDESEGDTFSAAFAKQVWYDLSDSTVSWCTKALVSNRGVDVKLLERPTTCRHSRLQRRSLQIRCLIWDHYSQPRIYEPRASWFASTCCDRSTYSNSSHGRCRIHSLRSTTCLFLRQGPVTQLEPMIIIAKSDY